MSASHSDPIPPHKTSPWFIGMMVAFIIFILIAILLHDAKKPPTIKIALADYMSLTNQLDLAISHNLQTSAHRDALIHQLQRLEKSDLADDRRIANTYFRLGAISMNIADQEYGNKFVESNDWQRAELFLQWNEIIAPNISHHQIYLDTNEYQETNWMYLINQTNEIR